MEIMPCYVASRPETDGDELLVTSPVDGSTVGRTVYASEAAVERAVAAAAAVADTAAALPAHVRAAALDHVSRRLSERADEVARLITAENGKPIKWARGEVSRAISTFRWAAEEARRFTGEMQRLDTDAAATGRLALTRRVPKGPVLGISPFNFPLNLVAHKVAPAIAVGAPIVLKPAPATPLSALLLGEILAEVTEPDGPGTGLPAGMFSVIPIPNERGRCSGRRSATAGGVVHRMRPGRSADPGGGAAQARHLGTRGQRRRGGLLRLVFARRSGLGRDPDRDVRQLPGRAVMHRGAAGVRTCRSVRLLRAPCCSRRSRRSRPGTCWMRTTEVGPVINGAAADRIEAWVREAEAAGATNLTGWNRSGTSIDPVVLENAPAGAKVCVEEVFGPVLVVSPVESDAAALAAVNDSAFGLQAGLFTHNLQTAFTALRTLQVGGVIVGDVPSYRADQMPYGGVKGSGVGREGLRYAMDDYTDIRVMVLTGLNL